MNKSYSKIRHIQESNLKLEKRLMNENVQENNVEIEITKIEHDERSNRKPVNKFHVNYQIIVNGELMEIEGLLLPYHTGRSEEHTFEPTSFIDDETEEYWENNWEEIEDEILSKFSNESY